MADRPAAGAPAAPPTAGRGPAGARSAASWWARRSLRARLTAATAAVLAAGMVLAAVLLVWQVRGSLTAGLDATAAQQAQAVAAQAAAGTLPARLPAADGDSLLVQVIAADGRVIAATAGVEPDKRLFTIAGAEEPVLVTAYAQPDGDGDDTSSYRVAALTADTPDGRVTVYAALPTSPVDDSTAELTTALTVGVPAISILLAVVAWLLLGRALRPVEALRRQAAAIPATDLHRRLKVPAAQDELGRLAQTLNDLLARIEAATGRQRQFVADAAHELRSPIASLRAQLEVAARHSDPAATSARTAGMLDDTIRLTHLVDDLLALARLDANPHPRRQAVDLDDIVLHEARHARVHGRTVDTAGVSAGRVLGEPAGLSRVVRNLLDNAARHATRTVTVALCSRDGRVTLTVADDGPGIAAADRHRVFERFTRLDEGRSRDAGGAGLGLAIVAEVVAGHGGTVAITDNHPGARIEVTLPAAE